MRSRLLFVMPLLALSPGLAGASELTDVRLHCRGARMLVDEDGRTTFGWVERAYDVDFAAGEVFDETGEPIASEITDELIKLRVEANGWPPGRERLLVIDRASGAWTARPDSGGSGSALDRAEGTCFRFAG